MSLSLHGTKFLLAPLIGWIVAQGLKNVLRLKRRGIDWGDLVTSGGMPSSHTAATSALAVTIGMQEGFQGSLFAVAALMSAVIMYDAMGVRRSAGEQGILLNKVISHEKDAKELRKLPFHIAKGHTPIQVVAGLSIGIAIGLILGKL